MATSPTIVTSPNSPPSDYSLCSLGSEHPQSVDWPSERGPGMSEEAGGRLNSAQFGHNL